jgi:putative addiction module killer protein
LNWATPRTSIGFGVLVSTRFDWGPGYRIYLAKDGEALIILFGGSTKKAQQKAIDQAVVLHDEYKARKKIITTARKGK